MRARDKGRVHFIRLDKSLDSSEFFKGHQVVKSPIKALYLYLTNQTSYKLQQVNRVQKQFVSKIIMFVIFIYKVKLKTNK